MNVAVVNASALLVHFYNKSLEERILRREFRHRPDRAIKGPIHKMTAEDMQERYNRTMQLVEQQRGEFLANMRHDQVVDTAFRDFWMRYLNQLYWDTRVYSPGGNWPIHVRRR